VNKLPQHPLLEAVEQGNLVWVKRMLNELHMNPGMRRNKALQIACSKTNLQMIDYLLQHPQVDPLANGQGALICNIHNYVAVTRLLEDPRGIFLPIIDNVLQLYKWTLAPTTMRL
jgi:hypothetical protein